MSEEMKLHLSKKKLGVPSPNKGKKLSLEWRKKLSKAKKGKTSHFKGKKHSLEAREKMSLSHRLLLNKNDDFTGIIDDRKLIRRERIKKYGGCHSVGEWNNLKAQYNWTCPSCQRCEPKIKLTRDHIIPVSKGGSDNIENIQPLCPNCNSRKSTTTIRY